MAQPGNFTPILLYGSSTPGNSPVAANLTNNTVGSEIAINVADKNLFFKDSGGVVNTVPIRQSSTSSNGWLSSTDWNTFNSKAPATSGTSLLYGDGAGGFSNVTIGSGISFAGGTLSATGSGGTVTSVAALTLGTTGTDLSSTVANGTTTPVITLNVPTASAANRGALSAADWSTFNGKQAALVSGTNIKTVGGVTLLGSGDVGTIGVAYGGTGQTAFTAGYVHFGSFSTDANFFWDNTNKRLGIGTATPAGKLDVNGASILRGTTSILGGGVLDIYNTAGTNYTRASVDSSGNFSLVNTSVAALIFSTNNVEAARFDSAQNLLVGTIAVRSAGKLCIDINPAVSNGVVIYPTTNNNYDALKFLNNSSTQIGYITCTTTSTAYNTSSDYRLKENIAPITGALAFVRKQRPVTYDWRSDGSKGSGYIAHWMQEDGAGNCVTGEKDAVDSEGNPKYQGIDTSFMVAPLNAAIIELADIVDKQQLIIEQLKAKVGL